jgi:hypothetical protein
MRRQGETLDASEPPRILFEDTATCSDGDRVEGLLRRSIGPVRIASGWSVRLRIVRTGPRSLRAEGEITDDRGALVASRALLGTGPDCAALAQAAGVWASLVLDAEARRPRTAAAEAQAPAPPVAKPDSTGADTSSSAPDAPWPAPQIRERRSPEDDLFLWHDESSRSLEVGVAGFLMTGTGGGAMAGPSPFLYIEAGRGVFLRPSLSFGETLTSLPPSTVTGTWINSRFDTCLRMPGLYASRKGIQLDLCAGADAGLTLLDGGQQMPFLALGPSADLRGELGGNLAVALRPVLGINLLRQKFVHDDDPQEVPSWSGRIELAVSWSLR